MGISIHRAGEGKALELGPHKAWLKPTPVGSDVIVVECILSPQGGPTPAHLHTTIHHVFFVLEGEFEMTEDAETRRVTSGSQIDVPPLTQHGMKWINDNPVRLLAFLAPANPAITLLDALVAAFHADGRETKKEILSQADMHVAD